jgi:hypothetical protein
MQQRWAEYRHRQATKANARTQTVRRLIERGIADNVQLASLLACSAARIAHHKKLLGL